MSPSAFVHCRETDRRTDGRVDKHRSSETAESRRTQSEYTSDVLSSISSGAWWRQEETWGCIMSVICHSNTRRIAHRILKYLF